MDKKQGTTEKAGKGEPAKSAKLEEELEEGLVETFPGSDAPTATQPVHHQPSKKH